MKYRPFYTYYVAHVIRHFFSDAQPANPSKAYRMNYDCAARIIGHLSDTEQEILRTLYAGDQTECLTIRANAEADKRGMPRTAIWNLISETERKIALARELI